VYDSVPGIGASGIFKQITRHAAGVRLAASGFEIKKQLIFIPSPLDGHGVLQGRGITLEIV